MNLDMSRQGATTNDEYSLNIDDALQRYEHAGHPRTARSIQRYCAQEHLDCLRQQTPFGEKYLITPSSVARHIAQIAELAHATRRDLSRHDARDSAPFSGGDNHRLDTTSGDTRSNVTTSEAAENIDRSATQVPATSADVTRPVATGPDMTGKYLERLEGEVTFLRDEISTKNAQIKELTERSRETNLLVGGLQRLLAPLLKQPDPFPQSQDNHTERNYGEH